MSGAPAPRPEVRAVLRRVLLLGTVLLVVIASLGLAVGSLGGVELLRERLARLSPGWLLTAVALTQGGFLFAGPRLVALLPPPGEGARRPGGWATGSLLLGVTVLNLSLPGPAGELAAAGTLRRIYGTPVPTALAASLHARLAGLTVGGLGLLVLLPFVEVPPEARAALWGVGGIIGLAGAATGVVSLRPSLLSTAAGWGPERLAAVAPARFSVPLERLAAALRRVGDDVAAGAALRPGPWLVAALWSAAGHLVFALALALCARAVGIELSPLVALVAHCTSVVASVALVLVPGGLGAWDVAVAGALAVAGGLPADAAAVVVLSLRAAQVLGLFPAAVVFLAWSRRVVMPREQPRRGR